MQTQPRVSRLLRSYPAGLTLTLTLLSGCAQQPPQLTPTSCPKQVVVQVPEPQSLKALATLDELTQQCKVSSTPPAKTQ